jgi:hypothetical protein
LGVLTAIEKLCDLQGHRKTSDPLSCEIDHLRQTRQLVIRAYGRSLAHSGIF